MRGQSMSPGSTSAFAYNPSAHSSPTIPKGADSKSSDFSCSVWGAWWSVGAGPAQPRWVGTGEG